MLNDKFVSHYLTVFTNILYPFTRCFIMENEYNQNAYVLFLLFITSTIEDDRRIISF